MSNTVSQQTSVLRYIERQAEMPATEKFDDYIEINAKKLNRLKHCVRSQITRLKLQKSFCDLEHMEYHYEYSTYNSRHKVHVKLQNSVRG